MKKIFKLFVVVLCLTILTGCGAMSENQRNKVVKKLKSEKVIDKKWEQVDVYEQLTYSMEFRSTNGFGYIYKDKDGNMYEIYIASYKTDKDNKDIETSIIDKYKVTGINNTVKACNKDEHNCSNSWVVYDDNNSAEASKYIRDASSKEEYKLTKTKHKILFYTYYSYKVEKVN